MIWHLPYTLRIRQFPWPEPPPQLSPSLPTPVIKTRHIDSLADIPCQNIHLYSIPGPSVTPGGDTQCSPTARCSPTSSPVSALQLSLFPHTSSQKTSLGKESVKQLRTSITKLTGRRGCEVPRLLFPRDCTETRPIFPSSYFQKNASPMGCVIHMSN